VAQVSVSLSLTSSCLSHLIVLLILGYIGSHTIISLLESGYDVTVVDNLINSNEKSLERVQEITQCNPMRIRFLQADIRDLNAIENIFQSSPVFFACIHFAGLKVSEARRECLLPFPSP
jgi:UDP-glucose 4-epimerase